MEKAGEKAGSLSREIILPKVKTFEQARNKTLEIIGNMGPNSKPYFCRLKRSAGFRKIVGRISENNKVRWQLDWDSIKGIHINIEDFSGCGKKYVIPFEGDEKIFETLLKHLN